MKVPSWEQFFSAAVHQVFVPGARILDIGAGLRIDGTRGNRVDPKRAWIQPLLATVKYEVLDPVPDYHPDIVGDVMNLHIAENTYDAVLCLAVLEHVPRPWKAMSEMCRVLKPGGLVFVYVPFLSPYHAQPGYYGDFFRFTREGISSLCDGYTDIQLQAVRGPLETLIHLLPRPLNGTWVAHCARWCDAMRTSSGNQVSGFYFTAKKPAN